MIKIEKVIEHKGHIGSVVAFNMGHRCGYVGIKPGENAFGKHYDDEYFYDISVHGGLTYSESNPEDLGIPAEFEWIIGFDCAHAMDARDEKLVRELNTDERRINSLLDMNFPNSKVRTAEYVEQEIINLIDQLLEKRMC